MKPPIKFTVHYSARNAAEAYRLLVVEANSTLTDETSGDQLEVYGCGIQETSGCVMITPRLDEEPMQCARRIFLQQSVDFKERSICKRGNTGCIDLGPNPRVRGQRKFLFFGWGVGE